VTLCHWQDQGAVLVAWTVKVAVEPAMFVHDCGCWVITGWPKPRPLPIK
jgi:hypothetical protein